MGPAVLGNLTGRMKNFFPIMCMEEKSYRGNAPVWK